MGEVCKQTIHKERKNFNEQLLHEKIPIFTQN